jgi:hypothetical protein
MFMNDEVETMFKESFVTYFKVCDQYFTGGAEEHSENVRTAGVRSTSHISM